MTVQKSNTIYKCYSCNYTWAHDDDACPNCGSYDFGDDEVILSKPYFHELEQTIIDNLIANNKTVDYIKQNYKQPYWCKYPDALSMNYGCTSLCDLSKDGYRTRISKDYCNGCECFKL